MRRALKFAFAFCGLLLASATFAQNKPTEPILKATAEEFPEYRVLAKTNPLAIIWGPIPLTSEYRVMGEFVIDRNISTQVGFSGLLKSPILTLIEDSTRQDYELPLVVNGFRFQASGKYYLNSLLHKWRLGRDMPAPEGFYIGPHVSYSTARFTDRYWRNYDVYLRISHFNVNLMGGYQYLLGHGLVLDLFVAGGYKRNWWQEKGLAGVVTAVNSDELGAFYRSNLSLFIGFNMGIALD